jgi:hypothetical protein
MLELIKLQMSMMLSFTFDIFNEISSPIALLSQFHKHFRLVTYGSCKISCIIHWMNAREQCLRNALAYFAPTISYESKMFMKS